MEILLETLTLPGAALGPQNPLPRFRDPQHDRAPASDGTLTDEQLAGFGKHTGARLLPYCAQDRFSFDKPMRDYPVIRMENDRLRALFLPGFGGRLWSLYDKKLGRELLFRNPVIQPANLALRCAWMSGGIEWNVGQLGHAYSTCDDVFFARCTGPDGRPFLRMYDYLRTTGLVWQVDFHFPEEDSAFLAAHVRVINPTDRVAPLYWWTNIAVPETGARVLSGCGDVIYINPNTLTKEGAVHGYGAARMPHLPPLGNADVSYPENFPYSNEYFFQNPPTDPAPWEASLYRDGFAFVERSTQPLRIRKMFCWGMHKGGRNWQDHLALPGQGAYMEIQAGLSPTQCHGADMTPGAVLRFTQCFGSMELDPALWSEPDWDAAVRCAGEEAEQVLPAARLAEWDQAFTALEDAPQAELLHAGHGWGALEQRRRARMGEPPLPGWPEDGTHTVFSPEEQPWAELLADNRMTPLEPGQLPVSWMTDPAWRPLLTDAYRTDPSNAAVAAALGVLEYENENWDEAAAIWRENWNMQPTAIVCRCLAQNSLRKGKEPQARELMRQAMALQGDAPHPALAAEYLTMLQAQSRWQELWDAFSALPKAVQQDERVTILAATAAGHLQNDEFLDRVFAHKFAVIREGETQLTDVWFAAMARRKAAAEGRDDLAAVEQEVRATMAPPDTIDFRLTGR